MFDFMMAEALANDSSELRVRRNARDEELASPRMKYLPHREILDCISMSGFVQ
jgi:hypothetical protein